MLDHEAIGIEHEVIPGTRTGTKVTAKELEFVKKLVGIENVPIVGLSLICNMLAENYQLSDLEEGKFYGLLLDTGEIISPTKLPKQLNSSANKALLDLLPKVGRSF